MRKIDKKDVIEVDKYDERKDDGENKEDFFKCII